MDNYFIFWHSFKSFHKQIFWYQYFKFSSQLMTMYLSIYIKVPRNIWKYNGQTNKHCSQIPWFQAIIVYFYCYIAYREKLFFCRTRRFPNTSVGTVSSFQNTWSMPRQCWANAILVGTSPTCCWSFVSSADSTLRLSSFRIYGNAETLYMDGYRLGHYNIILYQKMYHENRVNTFDFGELRCCRQIAHIPHDTLETFHSQQV